MNFLHRIFGGPLELIGSQFGALERMWSGSPRSRSLLLGFPALVIAIVGLLALAVAQYGLKDRLEEQYVVAVDDVSSKKSLLLGDLREDIKMQKNTDASISADDPRAIELESLQEEERIYLEKLISMNPGEPDYRYRLGQAMLQKNPEHGISIMKALAPEEEAGYAKAHRWLSRYYSSLQATSNIAASANSELALKHANYCLKRDKNDMTAKLIKSQVLYSRNQLNQAYDLFLELFEETPAFYSPLVSINKKLDREDLNKSILDKALIQYKDVLRSRELDEKKWVAVWENMAICFKELKQFSSAEDVLVDEIEHMKSIVDGNADSRSAAAPVSREFAATRRIFLQRLLSNIYLNWGTDLWPPPLTEKEIALIGKEKEALENKRVQTRAEALKLFEKSYSFDRKNPTTKRWLTRIGLLENESLSADALSIYDPLEEGRRDSRSVPALVLNELGTHALSQKKYKLAIKYYELAKTDSPRDPMVLNNLSYAWLICEEKDPVRALQLVDEGLKYLSGVPGAAAFRSNFLDTRGTALMQMERYQEAVATFEQALGNRQDNANILKNLVECYDKLGLDSGIYQRKLTRLESEDVGS